MPMIAMRACGTVYEIGIAPRRAAAQGLDDPEAPGRQLRRWRVGDVRGRRMASGEHSPADPRHLLPEVLPGQRHLVPHAITDMDCGT